MNKATDITLPHNEIEKLYNHDISIPTRTICIIGEITDKVTDNVLKGLHLLTNTNKKPLQILLNSNGGDLYHGLGIYDALKTCGCKVKISVYGMAVSAAALILQAGSERLLSVHSTLMLHDPFLEVRGNMGSLELESAGKENSRMRKIVYNIFWECIAHAKPDITTKSIEDIFHNETYFSSLEAVDLGLADSIIGRKCI